MAEPAVKLRPGQDLDTQLEAREVGCLVAPLASMASLVDPAAVVSMKPALLRFALYTDRPSARQQHFVLVSLSKLTGQRYRQRHNVPRCPHLAVPQVLLWVFPVEAESHAVL